MAVVVRIRPRKSDPNNLDEPLLTAELLGPHALECTFCGAPSRAFWQAGVTVACCWSCAINTLPALMADAIAGEMAHCNGTTNALQHGWEKAAGTYWRAAALAIAGAIRRKGG